MSKQNKINDRLNGIQQAKQEINGGSRSEFVEKLVTNEVETIDMAAIAEELQQQRTEEPVSANDGYTKDTLYIENDLFRAFNALCVKRGDKKKFANEAIRDFVLKKYREMQK